MLWNPVQVCTVLCYAAPQCAVLCACRAEPCLLHCSFLQAMRSSSPLMGAVRCVVLPLGQHLVLCCTAVHKGLLGGDSGV